MPGRNKKRNKNSNRNPNIGNKELGDRGNTREAHCYVAGHAGRLSGDDSTDDISSSNTPGFTTRDQFDHRYMSPEYPPVRELQTNESSGRGPHTDADHKSSHSTQRIDTARHTNEGRKTPTLSSDSSGFHIGPSQDNHDYSTHSYDCVRQTRVDKDDLRDDSREKVPDIEKGDLKFDEDTQKAIQNSLEEAGNAETSIFLSENLGQHKTEEHNINKDTGDEENKQQLLLEKQRAWNTNNDYDFCEEDNTYPSYNYKEDPLYIEAIQKYVYFWRNEDVYSQWYKSKFSINDKEFNCAEQYMMYQKAKLFEDHKIARQILKLNNPRKIKALGREVKSFNEEMWAANCLYIVKQANIAKFSQNAVLKEQMFDTHPRILVEASPYDKIWGIGFAEDEIGAWDQSKWRGKNLLGFILTEVRDELMAREGLLREEEKQMYLEILQSEQTAKGYKKKYQQDKYVGLDSNPDTSEKPVHQRGQADACTLEEISCRGNQGNEDQHDIGELESNLNKTENPIHQKGDTDKLKEFGSGGSKENNQQQKHEELEFETGKTDETVTQTKETENQKGEIDDCKNNESVSDNDFNDHFQSNESDTSMHNELDKGVSKRDGDIIHAPVKPQIVTCGLSGQNQYIVKGDNSEIKNETSDDTFRQDTDNAENDCESVDVSSITIMVEDFSDRGQDISDGGEDYQAEIKMNEKPSEVVETGVVQDDTDIDAASGMVNFKNNLDLNEPL